MDEQQESSVDSAVDDGHGDGFGGRGRRVAAVVPAYNEASRIALTVLAVRRLPEVDLVVVVDDASTDSTARVAEESGAVVVRLGARAGRTAALLRGLAAVAERDAAESPVAENGPRHLLLLDADLGSSAAEAALLLEPVLAGTAELALAGSVPTRLPTQGAASRLARRGIAKVNGFSPTRPLALELCVTRAALTAAEPLADGAGAGPGLIVDLLRKEFRVVEIPIAWDHRVSRTGLRARLRELGRRREVGRALAAR